MNILITAVGKRVQLIKHLQTTFSILGCDCSSLAPAASFCDNFELIPRCDDERYISTLLELCRKYSISALILLHEAEFPILDKSRERFEEQGIDLILSSRHVLQTCADKWKTFTFFRENGIRTAESFRALEEINAPYPLFIKPRSGMGSIGVNKINDDEELEFYYKRTTNPIVQQYLCGQEYTIDCFCDNNGSPYSIVPRKRIEVISGEVSKTKSSYDQDIINETLKLLQLLKGRGPLTIQCFKDSNGGISFTEINPRLGGGVPGTFASGIDYGVLLKQLINNESAAATLLPFKETTMLRFSDAIYS